jgi:hypothetical protein
MEAYKVKYGTKVRVVDENVHIPVASAAVNSDDVITILNLDGMYCNARDKDGNRIYIAAWTNVEEIESAEDN